MKLGKIITIDDLRLAAKRRLPKLAFDFIEGGVEGERCIAWNEAAFERFQLMPRYFVDVSRRSQAVTLFGRAYDSPFGICPTGIAGLWRPGADDMLAQAAATANIPFILSWAGNGSIEDAVRHAPGNMWFQMYSTRDRAVGERLIGRVHDLGVQTLVVTADTRVVANRERDIRNGFSRPLRLKLSTIIDGLTHPGWLAGYLQSGGGTPMMKTWRPYAKPGATPDEVADSYAAQSPTPDMTWSDLERMRQLWPGKLVVKGLLHSDDAVRATEMGADGIIVSNHGGRQFDMAPSPIEALPAVRAAVGPEQVLMLDSGIRRGSSILLALALGAQFVFVGRATLYGVAAFGRPGVDKAIEILRREIDRNMAQLGCADIASLGPDVVMPAASPARVLA